MRIAAFLLVLGVGVGCTTQPIQDRSPEFKELLGKKAVYLASQDIHPVLIKQIRASLLDQLLHQGTFILLSQHQFGQELKTQPDPKLAAIQVGADFLLEIESIKLEKNQAELKLKLTQLSNSKILKFLAQAPAQQQETESESDFRFRILSLAWKDFLRTLNDFSVPK